MLGNLPANYKEEELKAREKADEAAERARFQLKIKELSDAIDRPIGSEAVLNGKPVLWAGPDLEWQSPETFKKLETEGYKGDVDYLSKWGWQSHRANLGIAEALKIAKPVLEPVISTAQKAYNIIPERSATRELIEGGARNVAWGLGKVQEGQTWLSRKAGVHPFVGNTAIETIADLITGPFVPTTALALTGRVANKVDNTLDVIKTAKKLGKIVYKNSDEWYADAWKLHNKGTPVADIRKQVGIFEDAAAGRRWTIHNHHKQGIVRIDLNKRTLRGNRRLKAEAEQTGDFFNDFKAGTLAAPGKKVHHVRPQKVIDLILTGTEGINREILLSLAHDVFGGIGSTIENLQQLSGPIHNQVHAKLKKAGWHQYMDPKRFSAMSMTERVDAFYDLREEVQKINSWLIKEQAVVAHKAIKIE